MSILKINSTIRFLLFVVVFLTVMSVSFLVEAADVPTGAKLMTFEIEKENSATVAPFFNFELNDVPDGLASWYGKGFHGRRTASGKRYDMHEFTAAHKSLPFGTLLRVVNSRNGEAIIVEITDRGPFIRKRVVDLSYASAKKIGVSVTPVELHALTPENMTAFYQNNDTSVIVISSDMKVQVWPTERIVKVSDESSYASAASKRSAAEVILMQIGTDLKRSYAIARISAEDLVFGE